MQRVCVPRGGAGERCWLLRSQIDMLTNGKMRACCTCILLIFYSRGQLPGPSVEKPFAHLRALRR